MDYVVLDAPAGIEARLGWDPKLTEHDRRRQLARDILAARAGVPEDELRVEREDPTNFGHHRRLVASVDGNALPFVISTCDYRYGTVVAVAEPGVHLGIDIRDRHPGDDELGAMRAHSHLWEGSGDAELLAHWTRVQAILAADGRGMRVRPETVRLEPGGTHGSVPDRHVHYTIVDLSRNAFIITLAYAPAT